MLLAHRTGGQTGYRSSMVLYREVCWPRRGSPSSLSNVLVAFLARFPAIQTVQIVLIDEVFDVALDERRVHVEQVTQLLSDLHITTTMTGERGRASNTKGKASFAKFQPFSVLKVRPHTTCAVILRKQFPTKARLQR